MSFFYKIRFSLIAALIISILFSLISFAHTSVDIRNNVLRLHILANSDSSEDQNLKLRVRDIILEECSDIFDGSVNVTNAEEKIIPKINCLIENAENFISKSGFDYKVKAYITKEYFTTRTYENITLPAGQYKALKVIIGEGKGHNWWCVMFPPMCISAADKEKELSCVFTEDQLNLVRKNPKYVPAFKIIEIFESIKSKIQQY